MNNSGNSARAGTDDTEPRAGRADSDGSPELTLLWRTESGAQYAQDGAGRIYRNGELEAVGPLLAVAVRLSPDGTVAVGCRVLLLMDNGPMDRWRFTTQVTELYAQPVVPPLPDGWHFELGDLLELFG